MVNALCRHQVSPFVLLMVVEGIAEPGEPQQFWDSSFACGEIHNRLVVVVSGDGY